MFAFTISKATLAWPPLGSGYSGDSAYEGSPGRSASIYMQKKFLAHLIESIRCAIAVES